MGKVNWADLPDLAGVVALLHQADWTRLSLAGKVSGPDEPVLRTYRPGMSWNRARPPVTLHVAPGRRFRRDDGALAVGCDGERVWQWLENRPLDGEVGWEVGAVINEAMFAPPAGSRVSKSKGTGRLPATNFLGIPESGPFGLPLGPVKTAAGLAAGGLGAAIRYTPVSGLFRARADDGTGEPIPDDDPPFGASVDGALVSDDVLYLLYRSGSNTPRFTGTSHVWMDGRAILAGVPESVRKTGLGGVGNLIDSLSRNSRKRHTVSKVRMDGWQRYRIEPGPSPGPSPGKRPDPSVSGCDGKRYWEAHEDRVDVGKSRPAPADLADLTDASWLLGCELSGGEPVTFDSRAAFRLAVRGGLAQSQLLWPGLPAVAVVDAETGRLIRLTCYVDGKPACRYELGDVTPAPEGADGYAVPPGLPVVDVDSGPGRLRSTRHIDTLDR